MMKEGSNFDNGIIVRFLMNEADENDVHKLEHWLSLDLDNKVYFDQIRNTWNSIELEKELDEIKIDNDFQQVLDQIKESKPKHIRMHYTLKNIMGSWMLKGAAIFIVGFSVSWFLMHDIKDASSDITTFNVIETPRGSKANIILSDGSKVLLNAGSKLTYPQKFTSKERKVLLEGEAFFEIEKDSKRQFLVKTQDLTVKVFGTSFNVKSYPDENTSETTLVEGSISVFKNSTNGQAIGTALKMEPNQRMVLYKHDINSTPNISQPKKTRNVPARKPKLVLLKRIDTDRFISWKEGHLDIKSEPMKTLALTLERRYDVKIHFEDQGIKLFKFTGTFKNETIEQVMAAIKLASPIRYRIDERNIWISREDS